MSKEFTITERATLRSGESIMSMYNRPLPAMLDLIDNGVDNRIEGVQSVIRIFVGKDRISIENIGGYGLDKEGLEKYLTWGHSEKVQQIGKYGVGGKAAIGFLGSSLKIICSPVGSADAIHLQIPNFDKKEEVAEMEHSGYHRDAVREEGYFQVIIENLKKDRRVDVKELEASLAEVYRPLLANHQVRIILNNREIEPLHIPYRTDMNEGLKPHSRPVMTQLGDRFVVTTGLLPEDVKVEPGLRLYYRGRLIGKGVFPKGLRGPNQLPQARFFHGEVDLGMLEVNTNKTSFIENDRYNAAMKTLAQMLQPIFAELEKLEIRNLHQIDQTDQNVAASTKRLVDHVLRDFSNLFNRDSVEGGSSRRLGPTSRGDNIPPSGGGTHKPPENPRGATAPDIRADRGENIKRWGAYHDYRVVNLGVGGRKCDILEEGDKSILLINADFSTYQAARLAGVSALKLYVAQSAIRELARRTNPKLTVEEYERIIDTIDANLGNSLREEFATSKTKFSSRGTMKNPFR